METPFEFETIAREGEARATILRTRRGIVETPVFMPVGIAGTVKGVRFEGLESPDLDAPIILGNTYHLWLRPGIETIRACGGLHKFIGWDRAMLTDSGGFQVWSLGASRKITEEGVESRSHVDGSLRFLSPEVVIEVQAALGAEIAMAFDECAPGEATPEEARRSMELTLRWAKRSKQAFEKLQGEFLPSPGEGRGQALFGIVQRAAPLDLRRESLDRTVEIGFDGYAIGRLSVGEEKHVKLEVIEEIAPRMPADKPRYLMGVGTPEDLIEAVASGLDMFDSVLPARNGRDGQAFTSRGELNVKNARYALDQKPLDESCHCAVCRRHTRAFIHHLYLSGEVLASILLTHHNLAFFLDTMKCVRQAIRSGQFAEFRREFTEQLQRGLE
ncbi:MAG TPA: tRNA guanosine(34) transglycosylase Tgt [Pyrinomonadaceae bacterium]|jgi:queuine tRNA-ribosyltransferase|nr:tRNA guanosine(34) transglycosylase Tgt [Pyrinomonadaceae bacterium]